MIKYNCLIGYVNEERNRIETDEFFDISIEEFEELYGNYVTIVFITLVMKDGE